MGGSTALLDAIKTAKKNLNTSSETITNAHTTFTNQFTSFLMLSDELESKIKELQEREIAVEAREYEARLKEQQLEVREKKCTKEEKEVKVREKAVNDKETKWNETEKRMQENAAKLPNVIHLNVSGTRFSIEKEKLLQYKESILCQMMTTNHPPLVNIGELKEMFINRDPDLFKYIMRFLMREQLVLPSEPSEATLLVEEFEYFRLPIKGHEVLKGKEKDIRETREPRELREPREFREIREARDVRDVRDAETRATREILEVRDAQDSVSAVPSWSQLLGKAFVEKIAEWLPNKRFQLLYKANSHGPGAAEEFHKHCDDKGPTLTLIRSKEGYLFGGYSTSSWNTQDLSYNKSEGFIFTLSNPHNIPPTKYLHKQLEGTIFCHDSYGPTFGKDIQVHQNHTFTSLGQSYVDTTGKGLRTFTGTSKFILSDLEVFAVL